MANRNIYVVIQEGGSSKEHAASSYDSLDEAEKAIVGHHEASYRTAGPFTVEVALESTDWLIAENVVLRLVEQVRLAEYE